MKDKPDYEKAVERLKEQGLKVCYPHVIGEVGTFAWFVTSEKGEKFQIKAWHLNLLWQYDKVSLEGIKELDKILREKKKLGNMPERMDCEKIIRELREQGFTVEYIPREDSILDISQGKESFLFTFEDLRLLQEKGKLNLKGLREY